jgi:hypothetical protein
VDQGRLVAVRPSELCRRGSSYDGLLQDTVGTTASASWGDPRSATGSWKSGLRPAEGGPWWLYWTEGRAAELRSRLAPGPQERSRRCLGGGPVRLYAWRGYVPCLGAQVTVWDEAADGLRRKGASTVYQMCGVATARKLWFRGAV